MVAVFHESTGQPSFVQDCTTLIVGYERDILQARSCGTRMRLILGRAAMAEKCNQPLVSCDRFGDKDCSVVVREGEVPSVPGRAETLPASSLPTADWPNNIPATPRQPLTHDAKRSSRI